MSIQKRFHILFGDSRTTITVDTILFELMAIKLGFSPDDAQAHGAVRGWLQDTLPDRLGDDVGRKHAAQWARRYLIDEIADRQLGEERWKWVFAQVD